jgi:hypothetical protein
MSEFYDNNENIINSSLFEKHEDSDYTNVIFNNTSLKMGVIVKVYEIDDKENLNKQVPEYDVLVLEQNQTSNVGITKYQKCVNIDGFGGLGDFFEYKLRPKTKVIDPAKESKTTISTNFKNQTGNMVLLLCLNGSTDSAIIIKSMSHAGRKTTLTKENGLHLEGEYNGINWQINKNGEFTLTFKSPTNDEGNIIDKKYSGTYAKIDKTGSFEVKDSKNSTRMDNDKGGISSSTKGSYSVNAENNIENKATKDINESATNWKIELTGSATQKAASWAVEVSGEAKLKVGGALNIEASSTVLKSKSKVGIETNMLDVKGKSINLEGKQVQVGGAGGTPAVTMKTKFMGIGNLGAPVISTAIGPFSSVVFIK